MSRLARQLGWLVLFRLLALSSLALPYLLLRLDTGALVPGAAAVFWIIGLGYAASLVHLVDLWLLRGRPDLQAWIQFTGDLALVTALVWCFGGAYSPFSILYLVVIALASTMLGRRAGTIVAAVSWSVYAATVISLAVGWVPLLGTTEVETVSLWRLSYSLAIHGFGFFTLAVLTSHLAEVRRLRENLADLKVIHHDIIQSVPSGLLTADSEARLTSLNRAGEEILGRSERALLGRPIWESGLLTEGRWLEITRDPQTAARIREEVEWRQGAVVRTIGFSVSVLRHADGTPTGFVLIFQDLTGWRRLQEEMRLKDRMAAVGELAAGLAHEIGNPLAAISGSVQMLSGSVPGPSPHQKLLEIILKESQRLDRTIKGFLRFARPRERTDVAFDVLALLSENLELLRNSSEVEPGHRLEIDLAPPPTDLVGDPDQISQLFWNLSRNALRAMPDGGTLAVSGRVASDSYRIQFRDTGCGMTEEERANLFHPFHSFFDGGVGIGMAIVYRIVQEHGGRLGVQSRPGEGTTITVDLPLGTAADVSEPSRAAR